MRFKQHVAFLLTLVLVPLISAQTTETIIVTIQPNGDLVYQGELYSRSHEDTMSVTSALFWIYILIVLGLTLFAGLMSGLTVGLLSLDALKLSILQMEGTDDEKYYARRLLPVVKKHHLLLVTLLLGNAAAMEALPLFLDKLLPSWAAILLSVTLVLTFGEVVPQAFCTGPKQLMIASALVPLVNLMMILLFVVAYPISRLLDKLLGTEPDERFRRNELKALVALHASSRYPAIVSHTPRRQRSFSATAEEAHTAGALASTSNLSLQRKLSEGLHPDEVTIIQGALEFQGKRVVNCMIPLDQVFMLQTTDVVDSNLLTRILCEGRSRIPIYKDSIHNIKGLLLSKKLIVVDPSDQRTIESLGLRRPMFVNPDMSLVDLLNEFQKGKSHLAIVTKDVDAYRLALSSNKDVDSSARIMGLITLEDVLEELIQEEIEDELDFAQSLLDKHGHGEDHNGIDAIANTVRTVRKAADRFKELLSIAKAKRARDSSLYPTTRPSLLYNKATASGLAMPTFPAVVAPPQLTTEATPIPRGNSSFRHMLYTPTSEPYADPTTHYVRMDASDDTVMAPLATVSSQGQGSRGIPTGIRPVQAVETIQSKASPKSQATSHEGQVSTNPVKGEVRLNLPTP